MLRPPCLLDIIPEARIRHNTEHLADGAVADQVAHLHTEREVAGPHSLHEEEVLLAGDIAQDLGLRGIDGEGLLAEDVLPGLEGQHHVLEVVRVRGCDGDDVDVGVRREVLVGPVGGAGGRDARVGDELFGARRRRRGGYCFYGVGDV